MEIPFAIINSANKCLSDYACLNGNGHELCKVKECLSEKLLFVEKNPCNCLYSMNFGNEILCNCPVRKEIYSKYQS